MPGQHESRGQPPTTEEAGEGPGRQTKWMVRRGTARPHTLPPTGPRSCGMPRPAIWGDLDASSAGERAARPRPRAARCRPGPRARDARPGGPPGLHVGFCWSPGPYGKRSRPARRDFSTRSRCMASRATGQRGMSTSRRPAGAPRAGPASRPVRPPPQVLSAGPTSPSRLRSRCRRGRCTRSSSRRRLPSGPTPQLHTPAAAAAFLRTSPSGPTSRPLAVTLGSISPTEGTVVNSDVATFTADTSLTASDFTATIDWGDGTQTAGVVTGSAGSFAVSASGAPHTYSDEGSFIATVAVNETGVGDSHRERDGHGCRGRRLYAATRADHHGARGRCLHRPCRGVHQHLGQQLGR